MNNAIEINGMTFTIAEEDSKVFGPWIVRDEDGEMVAATCTEEDARKQARLYADASCSEDELDLVEVQRYLAANVSLR